MTPETQTKEIKLTKAFCGADGAICFGSEVSKGVLVIAQDEESRLISTVSALARHAYEGDSLLVPGIPEAEPNSKEALDALIVFQRRVTAELHPNLSTAVEFAATHATIHRLVYLAACLGVFMGRRPPEGLEEILEDVEVDELEQMFGLPFGQWCADDIESGQFLRGRQAVEDFCGLLADWNRYGFLAEVLFHIRRYQDTSFESYRIGSSYHSQAFYAETLDELQEQIQEAAEVWARVDQQTWKNNNPSPIQKEVRS